MINCCYCLQESDRLIQLSGFREDVGLCTNCYINYQEISNKGVEFKIYHDFIAKINDNYKSLSKKKKR